MLALAAPFAATPALAAPRAPSAQQWALDAKHFDSARLWSLSTGKGVTVAVVDSGVDDHHPDLTGRVLPGADFTGNAADGRVDLSTDAHGTAVAGIIAGTGTGPDHITGLAPDATILPVRISDTLTSDPAVLAQGINYATTHGAKIINISICARILNPQIRTAVETAIEHDIVVVAAAGNDRLTGNPAQYPAALPGVIAVAATDAEDRLWPKSESGPYLGVTAPGVDIYTTGAEGSHQQATGTSFAAPHVAAAAALLRARYPAETAAQIISRLTSTAHHPRQGRDDTSGYGFIDPYQALVAPAPPAEPNPLLQPIAEPHPKSTGHAFRTASIIAGLGATLAAVAALTLLFIRRRGRRSSR